MKVGTPCSSKSNVTNGIPQGSILGPTLFAIYINDLSNCLTSQCKMFADDLKTYNKSFNHDIIIIIIIIIIMVIFKCYFSGELIALS